jgi:hypothetical protein
MRATLRPRVTAPSPAAAVAATAAAAAPPRSCRCLSGGSADTRSSSSSWATLQQLQQRTLPPLVYHPEYSYAGWDPKHRFVMDKFRHLHELLLEEWAYARPDAFVRPSDPAEGCAARLEDGSWGFTGPAVEAVDRGWLGLAHDPAYVRALCEGEAPMRRIGLPWSPGLVRRTRLEIAGTMLAAHLALAHGVARRRRVVLSLLSTRSTPCREFVWVSIDASGE